MTFLTQNLDTVFFKKKTQRATLTAKKGPFKEQLLLGYSLGIHWNLAVTDYMYSIYKPKPFLRTVQQS